MIVHAVGDSVEGPHPPGTYAVVLAAKDEAHIASIAAFLEQKGVGLVRVSEEDPPYSGQLMALGLRLGRKEVVGRYVSSLPKLGKCLTGQ